MTSPMSSLAEPDPTISDPVAYLKQWIQWVKGRLKASREAVQDHAATQKPNQDL